MKKIILLTIFFIVAIPFIKGKAATYNNPCIKTGYNTQSMNTYYFSTTAQDNTTQFSFQAQNDTQSRNYIKPVIVRKHNYDTSYYYTFICKASSNCIKRVNTSNTTDYIQASFTDPNGQYYVLYSTPVFDDYESASNYSCGLDFDASHLIGGLSVPFEFDDSIKYSIDVSNFDYNFRYPASNFSLFWSWTENPQVPNDCDRMFSISLSYLDKTKLEQLYYSYGNDGLSWNALISVYKTISAGGVSGVIDYPDDMHTTRLDLDLDRCMINQSISPYIDYSLSTDNNIVKYNVVWTEVTDPLSLENNINPYGIIEFLKDYYGDFKKAIFSLNYISFNYIDSWVIKYTQMSKKVYDWYNTYYIDTIKSDGTVYEHKSFKTKNSLNQNDIDPNTEPNTIGDTPDDLPKIDIPQVERTSSYNQSIQDSYNNIVNNYYYNNNYNNSILDYYNRFADGGSDEDINGAFGYVKSTLGSLTHIPILLGMCFTGFLPPEVILLFNALLIVFVVFLIIRIIKHLFTH